MAPECLLAIETSCDETAAAVVGSDLAVRSSVIFSQAEMHASTGGVIPEAASREHVAKIVGVVDQALRDADVGPGDLSGIAVTRGPGLVGCLAVGISTAKALGLAWDQPVIPVNHLEGHVASVELDAEPIDYPALVLLVSGGHCMLIHVRERGAYEVLGQTRDDSVGEAYDKVARELGLGYPGGPIIDRLAKEGEPRYRLPRPMIDEGLDFSFSGLKTAVRRVLELGDVSVPDLAASFAEACCDVLIAKVDRAVAQHDVASVVAVGGVAASPILRARMAAELADRDVRLVFPSLRYATDNAAMIGAAAWWRIAAGAAADGCFGPQPRLKLGVA